MRFPARDEQNYRDIKNLAIPILYRFHLIWYSTSLFHSTNNNPYNSIDNKVTDELDKKVTKDGHFRVVSMTTFVNAVTYEVYITKNMILCESADK